MAFIPAVDTARVSMHFSQDNQQVANVFYVQDPAGWDVAKLTALGLLVKSWWTSNIQAHVATNLTLREVVLKDMTTLAGTEVVYTTGLPQSGTLGPDALPNNNTIAIKLTTGLGGRSFRGRQYLLGMVVGNLGTDRNTVSPTFISDNTAAYAQLISSIDAVHTPGLVVASFFSGVDSLHKPIPRSTAVLTKVLDASFADNVIDSQRRRLPGRGR